MSGLFVYRDYKSCFACPDADIDKFLYGELDLEDDAKDPSATDDDDTLGNYDGSCRLRACV